MSAETTAQNAPYAYPNAVLGLIHRYRARDLPEPVTPNSLRPFGISQGNVPRILQALGFLGLIDDVAAPQSPLRGCARRARRNI